jgi:hypothetical protein
MSRMSNRHVNTDAERDGDQEQELREAREELRRLTAERDAALADTGRLDWLASLWGANLRNTTFIYDDGRQKTLSSVWEITLGDAARTEGDGPDLRAAIDAAIRTAARLDT